MATTNVQLGVKSAEFMLANAPSLFKTDAANAPVWGLAFDPAAVEAAFWRFPIRRYGSGNITVTLLWTSYAGTTGDVVWGAALAAITPDTDTTGVDSKAFATEATVTDSHLGTTTDRVMRCDVVISSLDSLANDDMVSLRIRRLGSSGSDTMATDVILIGVILSYSDT